MKFRAGSLGLCVCVLLILPGCKEKSSANLPTKNLPSEKSRTRESLSSQHKPRMPEARSANDEARLARKARLAGESTPQPGLHYVALPLSAAQAVHTAKSDSSAPLAHLQLGEYARVFDFDEQWVHAESKNGFAYIPRAQCYVASLEHKLGRTIYPGLKHTHDLWFEVWAQASVDDYELLLQSLPDSTTITRVLDVGYTVYQSKRPLGLEIFLLKSSRAYGKDWQTVLAMWDSIAKNYRDYRFENQRLVPAELTARFQRAEVFAERLNLADSAYAIYLEIVSRFPGIPLDDDEWNNQSDVWAFSNFVRFAKKENMPDTLLREYYDRFLETKPSAIAQAIIRLHQVPMVLQSEGYNSAEDIWKSIISGSPLHWCSFKTSGEIRAAALWQWRELGVTAMPPDSVIARIAGFTELQSDPFLVWAGNLILSDFYAVQGDTAACLARQQQARRAYSCEYVSLALLPGNWVGPDLNRDFIAGSLRTVRQ